MAPYFSRSCLTPPDFSQAHLLSGCFRGFAKKCALRRPKFVCREHFAGKSAGHAACRHLARTPRTGRLQGECGTRYGGERQKEPGIATRANDGKWFHGVL